MVNFNYKDITGQQFGKLVPLYPEVARIQNIVVWKCRCECGNFYSVRSTSLRSGNTTSCGCSKTEKITKHGDCKGNKRSKIYNLWVSIKRRCYLKSQMSYRNYGAKGIIMATEWREDFSLFRKYILKTLGPYKPGYTLDRIDSTKHYEPGNIRWATPSQQLANKKKLKPSSSSKKYKGIDYLPSGRWQARIGVDKKMIYLGVYDTEKEAAAAYNKAATKHYGVYAKLNKIPK